MLTVDFDRLGVGPGTTVIDVGCGAGRHTFEAYRRGANVIGFDQSASDLNDVDTMLQAMREAGRGPAVGQGRGGQGRRAGPALRRRAPSTASSPRRSWSTFREDDAGHRRAGAGAQTRWLACHHGAALAPGEVVLAAVGRVPRQRGRSHPHLQGRRAARQGSGARAQAHPYPPRACAALAVLVAEMSRRHREERPPGGQGVPPVAGVGHDGPAVAHPYRPSRC